MIKPAEEKPMRLSKKPHSTRLLNCYNDLVCMCPSCVERQQHYHGQACTNHCCCKTPEGAEYMRGKLHGPIKEVNEF